MKYIKKINYGYRDLMILFLKNLLIEIFLINFNFKNQTSMTLEKKYF